MSKLIIQRTLNGLDTEYKSEGLNAPELEKLDILYDERKEIIQINQFLWNISITNTSTQKVISLIAKGNDRAGRAGFYAIRLLVAKGAVIKELFNSLQKIAARYVQHISQSTLNSQDYTDLLKEIDDNTQVSKVILTPTIFEKTCYKVVDYNQPLDTVLNDPILELVKKTYLFNLEEKISPNTFKEIGFTDLSLLEENIKKVQIENPDNFLASININNNAMPIRNIGETSFQVYALKTDQITIKDRNLKLHNVNSSPYTLKKPEPIDQVYSENHGRRREKDSSGGAILIGIFSLFIGAAGGYFLPKYFLESKPSPVIVADTIEQQDTGGKIGLKVIADKSQSFVIESNQGNLNAYTFKYDATSKTWKVRKRTEESKDDKLLTQEMLKGLLGADSLILPQFLIDLDELAPGSKIIIEDLKNSADTSNLSTKQKSSKETIPNKEEPSSSNKKVKAAAASGKENAKTSTEDPRADKKESENVTSGATKK